jgi:hypothetical protein
MSVTEGRAVDVFLSALGVEFFLLLRVFPFQLKRKGHDHA